MFTANATFEELRTFPFLVRNKNKSAVWCPLDPFATVSLVIDYLARDGCNPEVKAVAITGGYRTGVAITAEHPQFRSVPGCRGCIGITVCTEPQDRSRAFTGFYEGDRPGFVVGASTFRATATTYNTPAAFAQKACEDFYDCVHDLPATLAAFRADALHSPRLEKVLLDMFLESPRGYSFLIIPKIVRAAREAGGHLSAFEVMRRVSEMMRADSGKKVPTGEMRTQWALAKAILDTRGMWGEGKSRKSRQV